ncbi:unnamed protein product [Cylindrotheca closterium]|uniref:Prokaryotic-type class I peptide chain release factors domain-containing protein n=1 Tax=Cylindrotheca closterium TaxID=2856 RepID=A0AAD2GCY4_9STRA|nr:unnamed protein product [Cylindrotheca closterium]
MIHVERPLGRALVRAATAPSISRMPRVCWKMEQRGFPLHNPWNGRRYLLSQAVTRRLDTMVARHVELLKQMEENPEESYTYGKELASLAQAVSLHERKEAILAEEKSIQELLEECGDDEDMKKECMETLEQCKEDMEALNRKMRTAVLPKDEDDTRSNAIIEIRAGTGGDEAGLFASELRDTYEKTAKAMNFSCETLSESRTDIGGIKETVISVSARGFGGAGADLDADDDDDFQSSVGPYGFLRYESGVHRVQRVPVNDTRIHTSACSVAVLPLLEESGNAEELLPMSELKIETMRSSGAGGQHVNTTDSAVRITHIPTGITASIQDQRSQHKNKDKALKLIAARVRDLQREEESQKRGAARSSLMGGGDRSERIRTYNYPQDRITDHRCKHSTHGISKILEGGSDDGLVSTFFPLLRDMVREEKMTELEEEELRS